MKKDLSAGVAGGRGRPLVRRRADSCCPALARAVRLGAIGSLVAACAAAPPSAPRGGDAASIPAADFVLPEILGEPARPVRLLLIGLVGLAPQHYLGDASGPAGMPLLARLAAAGAAALAVEGVAPESRYPASASALTGRLPGAHGIVAEHRIGSRGIRSARYSHASLLRAPVLWQRARERGLGVAALDWPTTEGAALPLLVPDLEPERAGEHWIDAAAHSADPALRAALQRAALASPAEALDRPGAARDAALVAAACALLDAPRGPALLLLQLSGLESAALRFGLRAPETRAAAAAADARISELLACSGRGVPLGVTAVIVSGLRSLLPVHTEIAPNALLARAGLLSPGASWSALVRSNGGSAFVYANSERAALRARSELLAAAQRSRAFRVVSAEELLLLGVDPDAWFGLRAEAGYRFTDADAGPLLAPSELRAEGGYLPGVVDGGWLAWGRGIRGGVQIPRMRVTDTAPTAAALLGFELSPESELDGRALVGVLELSPTAPARAR